MKMCYYEFIASLWFHFLMYCLVLEKRLVLTFQTIFIYVLFIWVILNSKIEAKIVSGAFKKVLFIMSEFLWELREYSEVTQRHASM